MSLENKVEELTAAVKELTAALRARGPEAVSSTTHQPTPAEPAKPKRAEPTPAPAEDVGDDADAPEVEVITRSQALALAQQYHALHQSADKLRQVMREAAGVPVTKFPDMAENAYPEFARLVRAALK